MEKNPIKFLQKIGVDTRFISIQNECIFINNLRFSRFSRKKEEIFENRFPHIKVVRSKIFQRICGRVSRILKKPLHPKEKVFLVDGTSYSDFALSVVLEPYTRKYGIEIIYGDDIVDSKDVGADCVALPLTLDDEVENILNLMLNGEKIELLSSKKEYGGIRLIYPLINVPRSWIFSWLGKEDKEYASSQNQSTALLKFLEEFIPDVRENIFKSVLFVSGEEH